MQKINSSRRRLMLKLCAVLFAALLLLSAVLICIDVWERHYATYPDSEIGLEEEIVYNGQTYMLNEDVETLLVLGLDTFENEDSQSYRNDKQADFIVLLALNKTDNSCKAIQINRDTMAQINVLGVAGDKIDTVTAQIALSHTYGNGKEVSCRNTANAVSALLGVEVDHYVSLSMNAVPMYNDMLGGVTLEVMDDFTSIDPALKPGEEVTLTGAQALLYVRSRYGLDDPTNQHRMQRQKQYLQALLEATDRRMAQDEGFASDAALKLTEYMVSDCSANRLEELATRYGVTDPAAIHTIEGTTQMGAEFLEFYPNADSLKQAVVDCFYVLK